jgi:iron complex transport system permease protein
MKVTLDLAALREAGHIDQAEFDKLAALGAKATGSLAFNILIGFGVVAVSGAALALVPYPMMAAVLGVSLAGAGLALLFSATTQWQVLANICLLAGMLMLSGGLVFLLEGSTLAFTLVTLMLAGTAVAARSGLMAACAVLALGSALGARSGYFHATYMLRIDEPTLTIVAFSAVALALYYISKIERAQLSHVAIIGARTAIILVNFGFWIGSLWGDKLEFTATAVPAEAVRISATVFTIGWALALIGVALWAVRANRRWVVNVATIFGAIHFYTQWFERLGATPASVLLGGLLILAFAFGLWQFNRRRIEAVQPAGGV